MKPEIENMEVSGTTKWQEKEDLIKHLGMVASSSNGNQCCSGALNTIQDVLSSKNLNIHVLCSAVLTVGWIKKAANNIELIKWLAEVTETERSMPDAVPMIDKA
eukprot:15356256-Ditylum_brightwellii.AAC.1